MKLHFIAAFLSCFFLFLGSCKKHFVPIEDQEDAAVFPSTPDLIEKAKLVAEVETIIRKVYQNPEALDEVNAAIYSEFEPDESVSIMNLLNPNSHLYGFREFTKRRIKAGAFSGEFRKIYATGTYPLLAKYYGSVLSAVPRQSASALASSLSIEDSTLEAWVVNNVKIYFPYSEDYSSLYDPGSSRINKPDGLVLVTTVSADREADSGPGKEPYVYWPNRNLPKEIRYRTVTVNDAYAEANKATHIVNIGDYVMDFPPPPTPPVTGVTIYKTYIGWVRCTKQYDKLISLDKNGGGPELRFSRGYAALNGNGQVMTGAPFVPFDGLKRKDVRKGKWKKVMLLWDTNWGPAKVEQALGIWEKDTKGSQTWSSTVSYVANGQTYSATVSSTEQTQDAVIRNIGIDRNFFFSNGAVDQGWGFQEGWPIYDGILPVSYTMPYQVVN